MIARLPGASEHFNGQVIPILDLPDWASDNSELKVITNKILTVKYRDMSLISSLNSLIRSQKDSSESPRNNPGDKTPTIVRIILVHLHLLITVQGII